MALNMLTRIAEEVIFYFNYTQGLKSCLKFNYVLLVSKSCLDATVCQLLKTAIVHRKKLTE